MMNGVYLLTGRHGLVLLGNCEKGYVLCIINYCFQDNSGDRHDRGRMIVGFTSTYAISAYHHKRYEFESCSGDVYSIQHYVIKFVNDLRQVGGFLRELRFPPPIKPTVMI